MSLSFRDAFPTDAPAIAGLVSSLAQSIGETSPVTPEYVETYLAFPGCSILLAENAGKIAGLLSYSVRPNLYHNGETAIIDELVVLENWRGQGIGSALLDTLLARLEVRGCVEVSVTTMSDNIGAVHFYRAHGLVDEAIYLEKHF